MIWTVVESLSAGNSFALQAAAEGRTSMDQITAICPQGHRIRGSRKLAGHMVRCPKCAAQFLFLAPAFKEVTDTGVMRILGDVEPLPPPPDRAGSTKKTKPLSRPCPRCQVMISSSVTICNHCSCYVGAA